MTENLRAGCPPCYENELSIFHDETLKKIEDFRAARNRWITSYANQTINTDTTEGFKNTNVYKGRCPCLRRVRFKTTFLRNHNKTLRPFKCYTLKLKLSDPEFVRSATQSQENLLKTMFELQKNAKQKLILRKHDFIESDEAISCAHPDTEEKPTSQEALEQKIRWGSRIGFGKKKRKEDQKKSGPSEKALKKLKVANLENQMIESCRCDDGKELTVVIKGVCLCDKKSLNKFKINKVCEEYSKITSTKSESEKDLFSHVNDSLEMQKKRKSSKFLKKADEVEDEVEDNFDAAGKARSVTFTPSKGMTKVGKKVQGKLENDSMMSLFRNKFEHKSQLSLTKELEEKLKNSSKEKIHN